MKLRLAFLVASAAVSLSAIASAAPHLSQAEARKIALARVPGTVVHEKLKHKKKGHDLYYIKIKPRDAGKSDTIKKVEVDSESGSIVKIKDETAKAKSDD
jgi:uncharacterized membrane protein YkoI